MNVLFHTSAAIGTIALSVSNDSVEDKIFSKNNIKRGVNFFFGIGIISHGVLDFIPHCYPINSKIDAIISLIIILASIFSSNKQNKFLVTLIFLGSIFPDLIDLSPQIIEKYLGINMPNFEKIFPWHFHENSGSIYNDNCSNSMVYHSILTFSILLIVWIKRGLLFHVFVQNN